MTVNQERPNRGFRVKFDKRDVWVGVFWRREPLYGFGDGEGKPIDRFQWDSNLWEVFVCLLPMLVFKFWWVTELSEPVPLREPMPVAVKGKSA